MVALWNWEIEEAATSQESLGRGKRKMPDVNYVNYNSWSASENEVVGQPVSRSLFDGNLNFFCSINML